MGIGAMFVEYRGCRILVVMVMMRTRSTYEGRRYKRRVELLGSPCFRMFRFGFGFLGFCLSLSFI